MHHRPLVQIIFLLSLCAVLFLTNLGQRGLAYTEGHRVGPAWEMLDAGLSIQSRDVWLVPHLFEAPYLRKPPGMMWAIAASSAMLGRTELAARLPSALAMTALVLVAWRVSTRWFGPPWGLAGGMAQALFPFFWSSARSAEIESLHAATTGIASLLLLSAMLSSRGPRWPSALGAGLGVAVMVLTKGPAGLPVVAAIPLGACLAARSIAPLARPSLALVLLVPGVILGATAWGVYDALDRLQGPVITQGVSDFLWEPSRIGRILTLPLAALVSMCPAALALPWAVGRAHGTQRPGDATDSVPRTPARALAFALLVAIGCYTMLGVSNPRYTLPAATLLAPVAAWGLAVAWGSGARGTRVPVHVRVARLLSLGAPWGWAVVLSAGFIGFLRWYEAPRGRTSGDIPGAALGGLLAPDAERGVSVWADDLVECRPEVLLYARKWTPTLRVRWSKPLDALVPSDTPAPGQSQPRPGDILIVRTDRHDVPDGAPTEFERCAPLLAGASLVHRFEVHKYAFEVWRLAPPAPPVDRPATAPPSEAPPDTAASTTPGATPLPIAP